MVDNDYWQGALRAFEKAKASTRGRSMGDPSWVYRTSRFRWYWSIKTKNGIIYTFGPFLTRWGSNMNRKNALPHWIDSI